MLKRYFGTFDNEGWMIFGSGVFVGILTCLLTYVLYLADCKFFACIVLIIGLDYGAKLINYATLSSIYRHKDGKNKDLYLANKEHLDMRFKALFGDDQNDSTDKEV